jgi:hypothetical protein
VPHPGRRPTCDDNTKVDHKTGGIGGRGTDLCCSEQAKETSNLAEFLCSPLRHGMSGKTFSFCWYKVTGKPRGSPNGAVISLKNACAVQRQVVKQTSADLCLSCGQAISACVSFVVRDDVTCVSCVNNDCCKQGCALACPCAGGTVSVQAIGTVCLYLRLGEHSAIFMKVTLRKLRCDS